jgi:hypothetical protein
MFKKVPNFDEVYVIIPDINIDSYITSITIYTSNDSSVISESDLNNLFSSANKKFIDEEKTKLSESHQFILKLINNNLANQQLEKFLLQ